MSSEIQPIVRSFTIIEYLTQTEVVARPNFPVPEDMIGIATTSWARAVKTISNLTWLEGMTVTSVSDNQRVEAHIVVEGAIHLGSLASIVHVGIPFVSNLQTLPPVMQVDGWGKGRTININKVHLLLVNTGNSIQAGPSFDDLTEYQMDIIPDIGESSGLLNGEMEIAIDGLWSRTGQVCVRNSGPFAAMITGLTIDAVIGG